MISEIVVGYQMDSYTKICFILGAILVFIFGYYFGKIKAGNEYEVELEKLYSNQVDPAVAEMAWIKYNEFIEKENNNNG